MASLTAKSHLTIALAGNPNCGKTTIFNALTGLRQKVANYAGVTVEKKTGTCQLEDGARAVVIDLPGTYSLISRSPDETVAMQVLRGLRDDTPAPSVVIVVVDASNLQRNLYLVSQLIELGRPLVVALNMMDVAERRGIHVSASRLEQQLGLPVVAVVGHKRKGIDELKRAVLRASVAPMPLWQLPEAMKAEVRHISRQLDAQNPRSAEVLAERLLVGDGSVEPPQSVREALQSSLNRLSSLGIDPMHADVEAHYRWIEEVSSASLVPACAALLDGSGGGGILPPSDSAVLSYRGQDAPATGTLSDSVDHVFLHRVWGLLIFAAIMATIFVSIFFLADPLMGAIESLVSICGSAVADLLPDGPIKDLVTDGIFAGVGAILVFVPQIAILFFFLAVLEDSGYLARAAFLMDRLLAKVGLHGKSFIPLLSSFACAIPGIMATRTIENRKDRLVTIFVAPFMSCSARLPVYALLIGTFFASYSSMVRGGIMLSLYLLGIIAAVVTAWFFKRTLLKGAPAAFILELPTYKLPQWSQVARQVWTNTSAFITKAGTTIFCLSVILWAMMYYPRLPGHRAEALRTAIMNEWTPHSIMWTPEMDKVWMDRTNNPFKGPIHDGINGGLLNDWPGTVKQFATKLSEDQIASEQLRHSLAGRFGHFIEPAIKPLGYDWKMGIGLVGAFAAREVFVSTMAITYAAGDEDNTDDLATAMRTDRYDNGKPVWTPLVATSLLIWFVLAMQCMSTLAIVRRETGGWKWALFMLLYMNGLAYVVCLGVCQVGKMWFA